MPINFQDVIDALAHVCKEKQLKCAIVGSLKGGLITGFSAVIGGLLFGPVGLAIGGAVGGGTAAICAKNNFKPVAVILQEMTPRQKQLLHEKLEHAFRDVGVQDLMTIAALILSTQNFQDLAIKTATDFLYKEMNLQIVN